MEDWQLMKGATETKIVASFYLNRIDKLAVAVLVRLRAQPRRKPTPTIRDT